MVVLAFAVVVGAALGLLGGGGSVLAVPVLVHLAGLSPKEAIATSLLVVGATSAVGVVPHAVAGRVRWRSGLLFGAAAMAGAYAGGMVGARVPDGVLLVLFALMMLATAAAMVRRREGGEGDGDGGEGDGDDRPASGADLAVRAAVVDGAVVGAVTGAVGAGGGFLVVPALALHGGLPMRSAVGTSLVVIAMKAFAGLSGYLTAVEVDWGVAGPFTAAAVAGTLVGATLAGRVPADRLRTAFGWLVAVLGTVVLAGQVPLPVAALGGAAAAGAVASAGRDSRRDLPAPAPTRRRR